MTGAVTDGITLFTSETDNIFSHRYHYATLSVFPGDRFSSILVN